MIWVYRITSVLAFAAAFVICLWVLYDSSPRLFLAVWLYIVGFIANARVTKHG